MKIQRHPPDGKVYEVPDVRDGELTKVIDMVPEGEHGVFGMAVKRFGTTAEGKVKFIPYDGGDCFIEVRKLPKGLDMEVEPLFYALNRLPGIWTYTSCCGHGKENFRIWFFAHPGAEGLLLIARSIDPRICGHDAWKLILEHTNLVERPLAFCLRGGIGPSAYLQVGDLAWKLTVPKQTTEEWVLSAKQPFSPRVETPSGSEA